MLRVFIDRHERKCFMRAYICVHEAWGSVMDDQPTRLRRPGRLVCVTRLAALAWRLNDCRWVTVAGATAVWGDAVAVTCAGAGAGGAGRWARVVALARALTRVKRARGAPQ